MVGAPLPPLLVSAPPAQTAVVARPAAGSLVVHSRPSGAVLARLGPRSDYGSPLVVSIAARRGRWLGVIAPRVPNGRLGWIDARTVRTRRIGASIDVSLSRRRLVVRREGKPVMRMRIGIGAPATPTPTGRFAVTDKLPGAELGAVYGCCVLALSGNQPHPPPGWHAADTRLAIHGGPFGAVSFGCLHAAEQKLRYLMAHVPLGTIVTIRR
jgi:lipoprotein-anchoring transpeptidase ErfK/SrfK